MNLDTNNDPDLIEAAKELDAEFPGANYDDSLQIYKKKKEFKKRIIKNAVFHGFFYSVFTVGIYLLFKKYNISIFSCVIYGLIWFLFYILIKPAASYNISDIENQIRKLEKWRINNERQ